MDRHPLLLAFDIVGQRKLAAGLGMTHQALRKWVRKGRLPRTEWTGETHYSQRIAELTHYAVTKEELLGPWPNANGEAGDVDPALTASA